MSQTKAQLIDGQGEINLGGLDIDASAPDGSVNIDSSGNLQFNSGYGSAATAYGCRAWVNFDGTGTVAIRESGNVSSITDNGAGDYTVNFTTAMPDANYSVSTGVSGLVRHASLETGYSASAFDLNTFNSLNELSDADDVCISVFR